MQQNKIWYQINPYYFRQIMVKQEWLQNYKPKQYEDLSILKLIQLALPKIIDLGFTGIWIMPIWKRGQTSIKGFGSPYAIAEYELDPEIGKDEDLKNLITYAHELDLEVIGEIVPNHMACDASFIDDKDVYYQDENNNPVYDQNWYDTVKLNHSHPKVQAFISATISWLTKNYKFDGYRFDMAHYPINNTFESSGKTISHGSHENKFWHHVLSNQTVNKQDIYLLAEVYDDLNTGLYGYQDHAELIEEGFTCYDKKVHDILANYAKYSHHNIPICKQLYRELYIQEQLLVKLNNNVESEDSSQLPKYSRWPYLRIPSNHDDNPAIKIFGSAADYIASLGVLSSLSGDIVIYNGEEYGLAHKLSVIGENIYINNTPQELNYPEFTDKDTQSFIQNSVKTLLKLKNSEPAWKTGEMTLIKTEQYNYVIGLVRHIPQENAVIITACNLHQDQTSWIHVNELYNNTSFVGSDNHGDSQQSWTDLLLRSFEDSDITMEYQVQNMLTNELYPDQHKLQDNDFWIGLKPKEMQILKIKQAK